MSFVAVTEHPFLHRLVVGSAQRRPRRNRGVWSHNEAETIGRLRKIEAIKIEGCVATAYDLLELPVVGVQILIGQIGGEILGRFPSQGATHALGAAP